MGAGAVAKQEKPWHDKAVSPLDLPGPGAEGNDALYPGASLLRHGLFLADARWGEGPGIASAGAVRASNRVSATRAGCTLIHDRLRA